MQGAPPSALNNRSLRRGVPARRLEEVSAGREAAQVAPQPCRVEGLCLPHSPTPSLALAVAQPFPRVRSGQGPRGPNTPGALSADGGRYASTLFLSPRGSVISLSVLWLWLVHVV